VAVIFGDSSSPERRSVWVWVTSDPPGVEVFAVLDSTFFLVSRRALARIDYLI
jgi:hypothetical protein